MQPQELIRSSRLRISTSYWPPLAERARNAPKKPHCGSSASTSIPSVRPRQRRSEISSSSLVSQPGDDFRSSTALALAPRFDLPGAGAGFEAALSGIRRRVLLYGRIDRRRLSCGRVERRNGYRPFVHRSLARPSLVRRRFLRYAAPGGMTVTMKSTGLASCPKNLCESVISVRFASGVASAAVAATHSASVFTHTDSRPFSASARGVTHWLAK